MNAQRNQLPQTSAPLWPAAPASKNGPVAFGSEAQVNILMVDDREDKLLALEAVLSSLGQNLVQAHSGKEALRLLLHQDFAVILLDVSMPGMDGFETAGYIRQRLQTELTPIIFVTSFDANENLVGQAYSLGAVDYVLTPIVPAVLRTKVSVFVELYKKTEQIRQQGERLRQIEEAEHKKRLTKATERLEAETKRNRFFTLSIEMLAIAGFDGHFIQLNPTWEKTLGFTEEELTSKPFLEFAHPEDHVHALEQLVQLQASLGTGYFENRFRCKDGSIRWLGWTAAPFAAEKLLYIFARDISARKQAEQQIHDLCQESNQHLVELTGVNKQLEAFNYSISHDLRAPLRSIQGFTQALLEDYGPQIVVGAKDYLQRIGSSAKYMDSMLRDLLDYSRLSRSECKPMLLDLEAAVSEVLAQFQNDITAKKVVIEIQSPLARVWGHLPILTQIVANLVDNALKFTQEDKTPHIRIWTEAKGDRIRLCVEDNGLGIAPAHQQQIFGLFVRLHRAPAYAGTGIGLALVQKGAERMGGSVGVESQSGQGSRFWLELAGEEKKDSALLDLEGGGNRSLRSEP